MSGTLEVISSTLRDGGCGEAEIYRFLLEQFAGTPYVWGGSSLHGSDCSGSVCAALSYARNRFLRVTADVLYRQYFTEGLPPTPCGRREQKMAAAFFLDGKGVARHVAGYCGKGTFMNVSSVEPEKKGHKRMLSELRGMYPSLTPVLRAFGGEA